MKGAEYEVTARPSSSAGMPCRGRRRFGPSFRGRAVKRNVERRSSIRVILVFFISLPRVHYMIRHDVGITCQFERKKRRNVIFVTAFQEHFFRTSSLIGGIGKKYSLHTCIWTNFPARAVFD